jgi:hypothetical protein
MHNLESKHKKLDHGRKRKLTKTENRLAVDSSDTEKCYAAELILFTGCLIGQISKYNG